MKKQDAARAWSSQTLEQILRNLRSDKGSRMTQTQRASAAPCPLPAPALTPQQLVLPVAAVLVPPFSPPPVAPQSNVPVAASLALPLPPLAAGRQVPVAGPSTSTINPIVPQVDAAPLPETGATGSPHVVGIPSNVQASHQMTPASTAPEDPMKEVHPDPHLNSLDLLISGTQDNGGLEIDNGHFMEIDDGGFGDAGGYGDDDGFDGVFGDESNDSDSEEFEDDSGDSDYVESDNEEMDLDLADGIIITESALTIVSHG